MNKKIYYNIMNSSLLVQFILGIIVFVVVPYFANELDKPVTAAIIGAVPVPIFLTYFINNENNEIHHWSKMQLILPIMGIAFGLIFYLLIVKYKYNKNYVATLIILLWLSIGGITYYYT